MKIGSLFSGIGGLELGLEAAIPGAETVWQVEQSAFCRAVLERHWPEADRSVQDVREASAANLEAVDLICGGYPCQDTSGASPRKEGIGLDGDRSGLWFDMLRLVREIRPGIVVIENVKSLRRRGLAEVLGGLSAAGYNAEWQTFGAMHVGAWHRRDRIAVVAYSHDRRWFEPRRKRGQGREDQTDSKTDGEARSVARKLASGNPWRTFTDVRRVADGLSRGMDRNDALANAVCPQWAFQLGTRILELQEKGGPLCCSR